MKISIARDGKVLGEYTEAEIDILLRSGGLSPEDYYWYEGMEDWLRVGDALVAQPDLEEEALPDEAKTGIEGDEAQAKEPHHEAEPVAAKPVPSESSEPTEPKPATDWRPTSDTAASAPAPVLSPPGGNRRLLFLGILASVVVAIVVTKFFHNRRQEVPVAVTRVPSASSSTPATVPSSSPTPTPLMQMRGAASAVSDPAPNAPSTQSQSIPTAAHRDPSDELRRKVAQLPRIAAPPWYTSYHNLDVQISPASDVSQPLTATIRGDENVLDEKTQQALRRSTFIVNAAFREGEWVYTHYRASTTDLATFVTTEQEIDEQSEVPPSLISVLGLVKR